MTLKGQVFAILSILLGIIYSIVAGKYKNNRVLYFFIGVFTYWIPLLSLVLVVDCLMKEFSSYYNYSDVDLYLLIIEIIAIIISILILVSLIIKWRKKNKSNTDLVN